MAKAILHPCGQSAGPPGVGSHGLPSAKRKRFFEPRQGNGHFTPLGGFRQLFHTPFPEYTEYKELRRRQGGIASLRKENYVNRMEPNADFSGINAKKTVYSALFRHLPKGLELTIQVGDDTIMYKSFWMRRQAQKRKRYRTK